MRDFSPMLDYCTTDRQLEVINQLIKNNGNISHAAKDLGIIRQTVQDAIKQITRNAQKRGAIPLHKALGTVPEGFYAETSTKRRLNPETGVMEVVEDWTKSRLDKSLQAEAYQNFIAGLGAEIKPAKPSKKPTHPLRPDLASAIVFGDAHVGMLAHAVETLGENHDLETATADIRAAIDYCVECAVPSEHGWFINVGDFTHANDTKHATPGHGHIMDMSARHNQVMRAAGQVIRYCIDKMLTKFGTVTVINARGNHDKDAAFALNMYIEGIYEKEPRVDVQGNDSKFNFIEFGKCLIGVHHGDGINANRLAGVMTRNQAEAWGRTTCRRWILGHIHHKTMQEHDSGVTLESFHTLAPTDEYSAGAGYGAEQRVTMLTFHRVFGEVMRMSPSLEMIRAYALP